MLLVVKLNLPALFICSKCSKTFTRKPVRLCNMTIFTGERCIRVCRGTAWHKRPESSTQEHQEQEIGFLQPIVFPLLASSRQNKQMSYFRIRSGSMVQINCTAGNWAVLRNIFKDDTEEKGSTLRPSTSFEQLHSWHKDMLKGNMV